MENSKNISTVKGMRSNFWSNLTNRMYGTVEFVFKLSGLYDRGKSNALDIHVNDIDIHIPSLPSELEGYRILHLTDLHIDAIEGLDKKLSSILENSEADLCVMTGDYREADYGGCSDVMPMIERVIEYIDCPDGIYAVLGNHDTHEMVVPFENMGVCMLVNETSVLSVRGQKLLLSGTDDVQCYFTNNAIRTLTTAPDGLKVALVHSPELAGIAAECDFDLYLCGHTHAGQICLPGGRPIITHLNQHHELASGRWEFKGMQGYTGPGVGTSGMPIRFFTRPEITRLTLRSSTITSLGQKF